MDSEALRAHKKTLRTELRARRAQRYGGEQGARRRELEAVRLLEHGRPLLGEIFGRAAADGSGDGPVVAAYHPTGTEADPRDRKSTRLNSSHVAISYAVLCFKKNSKQND